MQTRSQARRSTANMHTFKYKYTCIIIISTSWHVLRHKITLLFYFETQDFSCLTVKPVLSLCALQLQIPTLHSMGVAQWSMNSFVNKPWCHSIMLILTCVKMRLNVSGDLQRMHTSLCTVRVKHPISEITMGGLSSLQLSGTSCLESKISLPWNTAV